MATSAWCWLAVVVVPSVAVAGVDVGNAGCVVSGVVGVVGGPDKEPVLAGVLIESVLAGVVGGVLVESVLDGVEGVSLDTVEGVSLDGVATALGGVELALVGGVELALVGGVELALLEGVELELLEGVVTLLGAEEGVLLAGVEGVEPLPLDPLAGLLLAGGELLSLGGSVPAVEVGAAPEEVVDVGVSARAPPANAQTIKAIARAVTQSCLRTISPRELRIQRDPVHTHIIGPKLRCYRG